jgi:acylphosphatase
MQETDSLHPQVSFHAVVHGRVQGVAFRYYARDYARRRGITGWIRNRPDGTVEVKAEGSPEDLHDFEAWLHEGPPAARVTRVDIRRPVTLQHFPSFTVEF